MIDVVTPAAGESVTEGTILEWHVKVGDFIKVDDTIVEISTDKVDVELPSPASGTVVEILAEEGDTVGVGQVIARLAEGDGGSDRPSAGDDPSAGDNTPSEDGGNSATEPRTTSSTQAATATVQTSASAAQGSSDGAAA
ncbi:MAG: biotin/lipoyl-containing protein, partial [Solirubrobacteraceae bacterium]